MAGFPLNLWKTRQLCYDCGQAFLLAQQGLLHVVLQLWAFFIEQPVWQQDELDEFGHD